MFPEFRVRKSIVKLGSGLYPCQSIIHSSTKSSDSVIDGCFSFIFPLPLPLSLSIHVSMFPFSMDYVKPSLGYLKSSICFAPNEIEAEELLRIAAFLLSVSFVNRSSSTCILHHLLFPIPPPFPKRIIIIVLGAWSISSIDLPDQQFLYLELNHWLDFSSLPPSLPFLLSIGSRRNGIPANRPSSRSIRNQFHFLARPN